MNRRRFIILLLSAFTVVIGLSWRYWWFTRRALIHLRLLKPPANLLRNAGFLTCTHDNIPDFWGTDAAATLPDFTDVLRVMNHSLIKGTKSLKVYNPKADFALHLQSCLTFLAQPQPYTFSVYLRSEKEPLQAAISIGWGEKQILTVGKEWQRYQLTRTPDAEVQYRAALGVNLYLLEVGELEIAAPQLEVGTAPTTFSFALQDDHPPLTLDWDKEDEMVSLRDVEGNPTQVTPSAISAKIQIDNRYRCLLRDGKPFMPFGIMMSDDTFDWSLDDVVTQGFNTIVLPTPAVTDKVKEESLLAQFYRRLDAASRRGLNVIVLTSHERNKTHEEKQDKMVAVMNKLKDHPSIIGWFILDEPGGNYDYKADGRQWYKSAKAADSQRPILINDNHWNAGAWAQGYLQATDIVSLDHYPIGQYENPLQSLAKLLQAMNQDVLPTHLPMMFWIQLYGNYDAPREPTIEELRAMTYLTFIRGVRLFFYFMYKPMSLTLWQSLRPLREELLRLEQVVLQNDVRWIKVGTLNRKAHYTLFQTDDKYLLIVCNISPERVRLTLDFLSLINRQINSLSCWYSDRKTSEAGKQWGLTLQPYEREVIEMY